MNRDRSARSLLRSLPLVLLLIVVIATAVALAWYGWSFYRLSLDARLDHPRFRSLRPSGTFGHGLGFAGALLLVTNLLYLVRRRLAGRRLGSMRAWLDAHVFTGLLGAVFVAFHSAFQLRAPIATVTAVSLAVVVATGIVGRLIYSLVPRVEERTLPVVAGAVDAWLPGISGPLVAAVDAYPPTLVSANASLVRCLLTWPRWRREIAARRQAVLLVAGNHPGNAMLAGPARRQARRAVRGVVQAATAEVRAVGAAALLRSWRSLHRFFAIAMLLSVAVHVGVAWHYGYRWIFE